MTERRGRRRERDGRRDMKERGKEEGKHGSKSGQRDWPVSLQKIRHCFHFSRARVLSVARVINIRTLSRRITPGRNNIPLCGCRPPLLTGVFADVDGGWRRCRGNEAPLEIALFVPPANLCQKPFHASSSYPAPKTHGDNTNYITWKLVSNGEYRATRLISRGFIKPGGELGFLLVDKRGIKRWIPYSVELRIGKASLSSALLFLHSFSSPLSFPSSYFFASLRHELQFTVFICSAAFNEYCNSRCSLPLVNGWAWLVYLRVDFHGREKRRGKEKTGTVKREERPVVEWTGGFVIPKENFQDDGGGVVAARSGTINLHSFTWHLYGKAARNQQRNDKSDTEKLLLPSRATPLSGISHLTRDCYRYPCNTEASDAAPSDPGFLSRILHYLPPYSPFNSTL